MESLLPGRIVSLNVWYYVQYIDAVDLAWVQIPCQYNVLTTGFPAVFL